MKICLYIIFREGPIGPVLRRSLEKASIIIVVTQIKAKKCLLSREQ